MENYYIPTDVLLTDNNSFSILWNGDSYRIFDGCLNSSSVGSNFPYTEVSGWGFKKSIGNYTVTNNDSFVIGTSCNTSTNTISQGIYTNSLFNAPNMTPYEPIYFLGFLALSVFIFSFALKLLFGKGWK